MWDISVYADEIYEPAAGFEPALALLQRIGIKYTELRVVNGYDHFMNLSDTEIDDLHRLLTKYGIKVGALGTPLFKCPLRGSGNPSWAAHHRANVGVQRRLDYQYYLDQLPRAFALADKFDTDNVRIFSFWREYDFDEVFEEVVDKLIHITHLAEAAGRRLFLENEHTTMARTGVELARLLKAVNSPHLTGIYDDGNSARVGGTMFPDDYEAMKGMIGEVHVKFAKLDVMCGWMSLTRRNVKPPSGFRQYFIWQQPNLPFKGQVMIGEKKYEIEGQRTFLSMDNPVTDHLRPLLTALKRDGYKGRIAIDNSAFEDLDRRVGRAKVSDEEATVERLIDSLSRLIADIWAEKPEPRSTP